MSVQVILLILSQFCTIDLQQLSQSYTVTTFYMYSLFFHLIFVTGPLFRPLGDNREVVRARNSVISSSGLARYQFFFVMSED